MKRERRFLWLELGTLGVVLGASVGIMLYLESRPELQRFSDPDDWQATSRENWKADFYQSLEWFNQGDFAAAETELLKIIKRRPGTPDAWQLLGAVYYRLNRMESAEQAFRHLIRQQPFNAAGYNNLSQTLIRLNRMPEALAAALRAAELAPGNGAILLNVAGLYAKERNDKEALYYLRRTMAAGVQPEVIARDSELVRLLERPEFMKMFEAERQLAMPEAVPEVAPKTAVAPETVPAAVPASVPASAPALVPRWENGGGVRLLTDEFDLPELAAEKKPEKNQTPVTVKKTPPPNGKR